MHRSRHRVAAAALALLLAATPAAALGPPDQNRNDLGRSRTGWLTTLVDWIWGLIGDPDTDVSRAVAASDETPPGAPPPQTAGELPANSETDGGPDWDPGG